MGRIEFATTQTLVHLRGLIQNREQRSNSEVLKPTTYIGCFRMRSQLKNQVLLRI
ncbi:hypothetical protein [aff. Roholtiella sp. LEGE 12411]|uniref:hypothetical protein n=1 Tax=aff. Roholtiella sp. LEGE 12411 TaxID=1828822 RepID=UPI001880F771|nr:hypothetical protein [aff. Roholtiella sp. LEGE 12411]MBE9035913.1 hypothetical protein [aff. Roholtiella sp. LEGE 12411]